MVCRVLFGSMMAHESSFGVVVAAPSSSFSASPVNCYVKAASDEFVVGARMQCNQYHTSKGCCFITGHVFVHICRTNRPKLCLFTKNPAVATAIAIARLLVVESCDAGFNNCTSTQQKHQQQQPQQPDRAVKKANAVQKKINVSFIENESETVRCR